MPVDAAVPPPGRPLAVLELGGLVWYWASEDANGHRLRFRERGEFTIDHALREVRCHPPVDGDPSLLPVLFAGTTIAYILALRGHCVLHASAVSYADAAIAFVGHSGRGKSTVAAMLCATGAQLVTDDVLRVDLASADEPAYCLGGTPELRLREAASSLVDAFPTQPATRRTADQRLGLAPTRVITEATRLAAIVIPTPSRTGEDVRVERIPPADAVFRLLSYPRLLGLVCDRLLEQQFQIYAELAQRVPVYEAFIPWQSPPSRADADRLTAALSEAGVVIDEQHMRRDPAEDQASDQ